MKIQVKRIPPEATLDSCLISRETFDFLNLSTEIVYDIHLGQLSWILYVKPSEMHVKTIYLPETIFNKFVPFEDAVLNIWAVNKDICLGPVVGIFETPKTLERIAAGGADLYEIQHMQASIAENCLSYYFSTGDIDWEEERIKGITFLPQSGEWQFYWFPMPDVLYDEGVFLTSELKHLAKQIRKEFRNNLNIQFINSRNGLNKWEVCERLSKCPAVGIYIPETTIYTQFDDIAPMLEKYKTVFLKSFHGSKGQEVLSIERDNDLYKVNFYDYSEQELKEFTFSRANEVEEFVNEFFGDNDLVLQQGIRLLKFLGRNFDIRVMLQKYEKGVWECSYITCRIAKGNSTITNISAGGSIAVYERIYPELAEQYGKELIPEKDELAAVAIKIATYIEREFGSFGELGMDMAVDTCGKIWLIEANAKPDKGINVEHVDIDGKPFIDLKQESKMKSDSNNKKGIEGFEVVLPQALATFKYAKFLVKCK